MNEEAFHLDGIVPLVLSHFTSLFSSFL